MSGPARMLRPALLTPAFALGLSATLGCPTPPASEAQDRADADPNRPAASATPATAGPEFVLAPAAGDVIELVAAEQRQAAEAGKTLLVYVGASWCEPCQYFHAAVDEGRFDEELADVRLLEFDLDRDRDRLVAAGYRSRMIPLFVAPGPGGKPGPRRTEGGVKGPDAVDHLRERLVPLVRAARADQASHERG